MVAGHLEGIIQTVKNPDIVMSNGMDLAVDRLQSFGNRTAKSLADDLMAQTDTQDRDFTLKAVDDIETDAGFVGGTWPR